MGVDSLGCTKQPLGWSVPWRLLQCAPERGSFLSTASIGAPLVSVVPFFPLAQVNVSQAAQYCIGALQQQGALPNTLLGRHMCSLPWWIACSQVTPIAPHTLTLPVPKAPPGTCQNAPRQYRKLRSVLRDSGRWHKILLVACLPAAVSHLRVHCLRTRQYGVHLALFAGLHSP